jgi:iron complex transport system ATP-binding protein
MNPSLLFQIRNLTVRRDQTYILRAIDWTVQQGEHWVILGANGSGKTSLLKTLTGYMTPTDGEITLLGEEFGDSDWRELRKRVGVVSASISHLVHEEDEAIEVVVGGRQAMIGVWGPVAPEDMRRAKRLLSLMRAAYLAGRRWEVLSQGERQRVLIARALMANPTVLVLDEPCAGLDPVARERFLIDIRELAAKKNAPCLVFVTHHIEEILPEFTHLLALRHGRIAYSGDIENGMRSAVLNEVFDAKLSLRRTGERWRLQELTLGEK